MAKVKTVYVCKNCGNESPKIMGRCFSCNEWDTYEEKVIEPKSLKAGSNYSGARATAKKLKEVLQSNSDRIISEIGEFDRVMGGGIVRDSMTILSAPPGMGKSTLLLNVANSLAELGFKILYGSGEESDSQIKNRADRTVKRISDNFWVLSDNSMDTLLLSVDEVDADLIIVDSINTFTLAEYSGSRANSPTQLTECASALKDKCKNPVRPRACIIVGQMTKEDELGGPRTLEHLVDTVLYLEGVSGEDLRHLVPKKNRFGDTSESGLFCMAEEGMIEISNPSEFFMTKRDVPEAGSALAVIKDGTRPIVIEIESLVSHSTAPFPTRTALCFSRKEQLSTLVSILEQRGGINLYDKNVVIQTTGGIKLVETSVNLGVIMSIVSSVYKKGIPTDTVFIGELGLTGELKKVPAIEQRLKELDRMGFAKAYVPVGSIKGENKFKNLKVIECKRLIDVICSQFEINNKKGNVKSA